VRAAAGFCLPVQYTTQATEAVTMHSYPIDIVIHWPLIDN